MWLSKGSNCSSSLRQGWGWVVHPLLFFIAASKPWWGSLHPLYLRFGATILKTNATCRISYTGLGNSRQLGWPPSSLAPLLAFWLVHPTLFCQTTNFPKSLCLLNLGPQWISCTPTLALAGSLFISLHTDLIKWGDKHLVRFKHITSRQTRL